MAIVIVCGLCVITALIIVLVVRAMSVCWGKAVLVPVRGEHRAEDGIGPGRAAASMLSSLVSEDQDVQLVGCGSSLGQKLL